MRVYGMRTIAQRIRYLLAGQSINVLVQGFTAGIDQATTSPSSFGVYPNPTSGHIQFSGTVASQVEVLDMYGSVLSGTTGAVSDIDISDLPKGFYFLRVTVNESIVVKRIVKQ